MDYHKALRILGLTASYTEKDLKNAYRQKAKETHPDINQGNSDRFKVVDGAYRYLRDKRGNRAVLTGSSPKTAKGVYHGHSIFNYTTGVRKPNESSLRVFHGESLFSYVLR